MAQALLALMWVPFLMCLVLTGIHAYLGLHVIAREVVFVDIALAQIAALGATAAVLWDYDLESWESYVFGLSFTILGALVFALTRSQKRRVSQEAIIGVVVTSSVRIAGVLLVFSYLIVPTLAANLLGGSVARRLAMAWAFGTLVSVIAMVASAMLDLPTGATVVCAFGLILLLLAVITRARGGMAPA